jgi:hypothetical protein
MQKRSFNVLTKVSVTIDEDKFGSDFLEYFQEECDDDTTTLSDHFCNLAAEFVDGGCNEYIKYIVGYGDLNELGIKFSFIDQVVSEI